MIFNTIHNYLITNHKTKRTQKNENKNNLSGYIDNRFRFNAGMRLGKRHTGHEHFGQTTGYKN
jgi:hypothetical protein